MTVDVEDYYHLCGERGQPSLDQWDKTPGRIELGLHKILSIFEQHDIKATFFVLGYIANRYPNLIREISNAGHEIASHGMYHKLVFNMDKDAFTRDATESRKLIEDLIGRGVNCFRSPSFSITKDTPWYVDSLIEAGYSSDSSLFPVKREDGGWVSDHYGPHQVFGTQGSIVEFPISVAQFWGRKICFFGGGYLRLFPLSLILKMSRQLQSRGLPVLYYIHPRELDVAHPRFKMKPLLYFKTYVKLSSMEPKLNAILASGKFVTCEEYATKYMVQDER